LGAVVKLNYSFHTFIIFINPEKNGADPSCRFREKRINRSTPIHFTFKKITSPSLQSQFQASEKHGFQKAETYFVSVNSLTGN